MAWESLNDVYVSNTGGDITGDLAISGNLTVNDGSGNGTTIDVANEIAGLKENKILATTASYMVADQVIELSELVSDQPNGIVLVWSGYNNGSEQNYDWIFTFVPKHHVLNHNGGGVCCSALCSDGHMMKYVYVSDTHVTGHSSGTDTGTYGGVTRANNKYVLRYVLGV